MITDTSTDSSPLTRSVTLQKSFWDSIDDLSRRTSRSKRQVVERCLAMGIAQYERIESRVETEYAAVANPMTSPAPTPSPNPSASHGGPISGLPGASTPLNFPDLGPTQKSAVRSAQEAAMTPAEKRESDKMLPDCLVDVKPYRLKNSVWFPLDAVLKAYEVTLPELAGLYMPDEDVRPFEGVQCIDSVLIGFAHEKSKLPLTITSAIKRHLAKLTEQVLA